MGEVRAVFARGGTSKGLIFHLADLPVNRAEWPAILLAAMGSPDPAGRQLDGMGGGVSSLSKVCVVGPPTHPDADVDYLFIQVQVKHASIDVTGNCGNMASAIGPFAVAEGLVSSSDGPCTVRIHNVNTGKLMHSTFEVRSGRATERGDLAIPGVTGLGASIRIDFIDPGGAQTGRVLPAAAPTSTVEVPGVGLVEMSLVDVSNACIFIRAGDVGLTGTELPDRIESDPELVERLALIRAAGSVAMGLQPSIDDARASRLVPLIALVASPAEYSDLAGTRFAAADFDLGVRMISNGQPHRAIPMTGALCTAVAARIPGTIPNSFLAAPPGPVRLGMPSGVLAVDADVQPTDGAPAVGSGSIYRTSRRLFSGTVHY